MQLVRCLRGGERGEPLRHLLAERRRMLRELQAARAGASPCTSMAALAAAVAESDRTVEALIV